jgi:hypothetical protein
MLSFIRRNDEERLDVLIALDTPLFKQTSMAETDQILRILRAADVLWNPDRRPVLCCVEGESLRAEDSGARIFARHNRG